MTEEKKNNELLPEDEEELYSEYGGNFEDEEGDAARLSWRERQKVDDYGYDEEVYNEYGGYTNSAGPAAFKVGSDFRPAGPSDPALRDIVENMSQGNPVKPLPTVVPETVDAVDIEAFSSDTAFDEYGSAYAGPGMATTQKTAPRGADLKAGEGMFGGAAENTSVPVEQESHYEAGSPTPFTGEKAPGPEPWASTPPVKTPAIPAPSGNDGGSNGGNNGGGNAGSNGRGGNNGGYTVVKSVGKKKRSWGTILACAGLSLLLGLCGGFLAARTMTAQLNDEVAQMMENADSTVMYRSVQTTESGSEEGISVPAVAELCADSVVEISTTVPVTGWSFFGPTQSIAEGAGSGVIISENGYILTCAHVIKSAQTITVGLRNGNSYEATVLGSDAESDVAVLKIEPEEELAVAVFGDSSELQVGEPVVAIGNPLGQLGGSVTSGIISALNREITIPNVGTFNVVQTDAAINGGNSGGGLFNAKGELVGLVNSKASDIGVEGLAFALPIDDIKSVVEDMFSLDNSAIDGVKLGVMLVDIFDTRTMAKYMLDEFGCYILEVNPGSNAAYAGLQSGDMLVSIDGEEIEGSDQVVDIISGHKANDVIEVVIKRNGKERTLDITLYEEVPESGVTSSL